MPMIKKIESNSLRFQRAKNLRVFCNLFWKDLEQDISEVLVVRQYIQSGKIWTESHVLLLSKLLSLEKISFKVY